jgi:hypothetical protein
MKIVFLTSHSANNLDVFMSSLKNHQDYCNKHMYTLINCEGPYSVYVDMALIKSFFKKDYDIVVIIGTDVLIQKLDNPITAYMPVNSGITMCREIANGNALNGDFIIISKSCESDELLTSLQDTQKRFATTQDCLNELQSRIHVSPYLQIAAPSMNPTIDYTKFNLGDYFSVHYHTIGAAPIVSEKAKAMRADLGVD